MMLFAALLMSFGAQVQAADRPFQTYYDNREGAQIAQCVREQMLKAPIAELASFRPGQGWSCLRVMYLWDSNQQLALLVDRDRTKAPFFRFENISVGGYPALREFQSQGSDVLYTIFGHQYQHGLVSQRQTGPAPTKENFGLVTANGFLLMEESTSMYPRAATEWPSLSQHPRAILRDTPVTPESFLNLATMYSVCTTGDLQVEKLPCF